MKLKNILFLASSSLILFANPLQGAAKEIVSEPTQTVSSLEDVQVKAQINSQYVDNQLVLTVNLAETTSVKEVSAQVHTEDHQIHILSFKRLSATQYEVRVAGETLAGQDSLIYLKLVTDIDQTLTFQPALISLEETPVTPSSTTASSSQSSQSTTAASSSNSSATASSTAPSTSSSSTSPSVAPATQPVNQPSGTIAISNQTATSFDITVSNVKSPAGLQAVRVPVWSETNGQDDIVWYDAKKQANGTYTVTVQASQHKNSSGVYHAHLYYLQNDSKLVGVAAASTKLEVPKPSGTIAISNQTATSFDITVSNVKSPAGLQAVRVPVWSETNGQDDIVWYDAKKQANGTYTVTVQASQHKNSSGVYHAHLYYLQNDNKLVGVAATSTKLEAPKPSGTIAISNQTATSFDITVSNVKSPAGLQAVRVPVWSETNGQDDIIWYDAKKQANGTYTVTVQASQHKNSSGVYHAHLYYLQSDNKLVGVAAATTKLEVPKPSGTIAISNQTATSFDITVSNVKSPAGLQAVRVPVWSETNGQDDIVWYDAKKQANGTYTVTVQASQHKNSSGVYHAHLYYLQNDSKLIGVAAATTKLEVPKPSATLNVTNKNDQTGSFDVEISKVSGAQQILVPIWSDEKGQDDIVWYSAQKQSNGTYKVSVDSSKHNYNQGTYHIHLYAQDSSGQLVSIGGTSTKVTIKQTQPTASIRIENVNNTYGIFEVVVSDIFAPKGLGKIQIPVWSATGSQNDIRWYEPAKQADGTYRLMVRLANHHYESGIYHAHLYITTGGQLVRVGEADTTVNYTQRSVPSFIDVSSHNGSLSTSDYRTMMNQGVSGVVVKLTEGVTYTNPYAAEQIRNAQAAGLRVSAYHYSHFTSSAEAQAEARYFVEAAKRLGLPASTVMVNDIEEYYSRNNINVHMKAWEAEMQRLGYSNLVHYASASWMDVNTLGVTGPIQTQLFGMKNFWVAQYPQPSGMTLKQAGELNLHATAAAWQFTSRASLLPNRPFFDLNIDYTGRFTN